MITLRQVVEVFAIHQVQIYTFCIFHWYSTAVIGYGDSFTVARKGYLQFIHAFFGHQFCIFKIFAVLIDAVHAGFIQAFPDGRNNFYFVMFNAIRTFTLSNEEMLTHLRQGILTQPHTGSHADMLNIGKLAKLPAGPFSINLRFSCFCFRACTAEEGFSGEGLPGAGDFLFCCFFFGHSGSSIQSITGSGVPFIP